MDDVQCTGTVSSLAECSFTGWGIHNCSDSEAVGVSCGELAAISLNEATWSGATLTLHFDRVLDDRSVPSPDDFVVMTESPRRERTRWREVPWLSHLATWLSCWHVHSR